MSTLIGKSLIASSVVSFLASKYLIRINTIKNIIEHWGLVAIYETRQGMNRKTDDLFPSLEKNLDIIAWGLQSFRDGKGKLVEAKVKQGWMITFSSGHIGMGYPANRPYLMSSEDHRTGSGITWTISIGFGMPNLSVKYHPNIGFHAASLIGVIS